MMHLAAFYKSVDSAAALTRIDPVSDQAIHASSTGFVVPTGVSRLLGEAALSAQTAPARGQVQSPSLRQFANQDVLPIVAAVKFGGNPAHQPHFDNPRDLKADEEIQFFIDATGGAAAVNYGLVWLGDAPTQSVHGNIFTVEATAAAALAAGAWESSSLTFGSTLPSGVYNVVGMRAQGTNLVAARLSFVGGMFRPGVPAVNAVGDADDYRFRMGRIGSFGTFNINQPPQVECLGVTDTSQVITLDLIKVQ